MKTIVLGLGNDLYGDDAAGLYVVRKLKQAFEKEKRVLFWMKDIDFLESSLSGIKLLELIVDYDHLFIIDTVKKENPVTGRMHIFEAKELRHIPGPSPHYVSIPQMLDLGKRLGLRVPRRIKVVAIEAQNIYNLGEGLSEEMKKSLPQIVKKTKKLLKELIVQGSG